MSDLSQSRNLGGMAVTVKRKRTKKEWKQKCFFFFQQVLIFISNNSNLVFVMQMRTENLPFHDSGLHLYFTTDRRGGT